MEKKHLIGFEAVGIQRFVTASKRPIAIQGASAILKGFDLQIKKKYPYEIIFAGGARGLLCVSEDQVENRIQAIQNEFTQKTCGLPLAISHVPYDENHEEDSLRWLELKQKMAHDACGPEHVALTLENGICTDCQSRPAECSSPRPNAENDKICKRCENSIKIGRGSQQQANTRWTFEDLAENNLMAMISADGNQMGHFFHSLKSLKSREIGSKIIFEIFKNAHENAIRDTFSNSNESGSDKYIAAVTGGDDLRIFMRPSDAMTYVKHLIYWIEKRSNEKANEKTNALHALSNCSRKQLKELGIGVGLLIAPHYYPASRLAYLSHKLEDHAKEYGRKNALRSTISYAVFKSDSEPDSLAETPISGQEWANFIVKIDALSSIPPNQRSNAAAAFVLEDAERDNLLRYQLARHKTWQRWFETFDIDWKSPNDISERFPTPGMLALASLNTKNVTHTNKEKSPQKNQGTRS